MISIRFNKQEIAHTDHGGFQQRNPSVLRLFTAAWKSMPKEELPEDMKEMKIWTHDYPNSTPWYPIANTPENLHKSFPCFLFDRWVDAHIDDYTDMVKQIREAAKAPPTIHKAFWIGANTHHTRTQLVNIGRKHEDLMDTRMIEWCDASCRSRFVSLPDHTKYKYLIEMQGGGYSARLKLLLHAQRLLFVQDRPYWDWVAIHLKPWVHYVPVKSDLSDLVEKLQWAEAHPKEVRDIIERCDQYALEYATRDRAIQHICDLIRKCAT